MPKPQPSFQQKLNVVETTCNELKSLMQQKSMPKVYEILRNLKRHSQGGDISYFLDALLPFGDLLFYRFVKDESRDIINSFHTFDKILHKSSTEDVINLLKFHIVEPEHSAIVNDSTVETVLYMIIQLSEYRDEIIDFVFHDYARYVSLEGLTKHMLFTNITNDIMVYIKAIREKNLFTEEYVTFKHVLLSFERMCSNEDTKHLTRSRLNNVIRLYIGMLKKNSIMLPNFSEFQNHFHKLYTIQNNNQALNSKTIYTLMNKLCIECYNYINNDDELPWCCKNFYAQ
jgi:hypothetical protein